VRARSRWYVLHVYTRRYVYLITYKALNVTPSIMLERGAPAELFSLLILAINVHQNSFRLCAHMYMCVCARARVCAYTKIKYTFNIIKYS